MTRELPNIPMARVLCSNYLSNENNLMVAITTDNATKTEDILQNLQNPTTKFTLLHTELPVSSPQDKTHQRYPHRTHFLPLHLAVICHAKGVVKRLFQHGVDVTQRDFRGNNVLHTLINVSAQLPCKDHVKSADMYYLLITLFKGNNVIACLYQEDAKGLRPLELAASLGHFHLMNAIFFTPGVYLCKTEIFGFQLLQYFRVTEYEKFSDRYMNNKPVREHVSPLRLLVQLSQCSVDMLQAKTTLLCEPLSTWVLGKFQLNRSFIALRLMLCLLELISFFILTRPQWFNTSNEIIMSSADVTNLTVNKSVGICASIPEENNLALIFIICFTTVSLIVDIYGILNGNTLSKIPRKLTFRNTTRSGFCVLVDFCSSMAMMAYCLLSLWVPPHTQVATIMFQSLYFGIIACAIGRLIRRGLAVECVRKYAMTLAALSSTVFYIVIFFSLVFGALLQRLRVLQAPDVLWDPLSYFDLLYQTFLILLNIETIENVETNHPALLKEFHVIGYFSIVVLLFSFLIATMVNTYGNICCNFGVYTAMYLLDTAFHCQDCTPPIIARLYPYFLHKAFVTQGEEVYIVRLKTTDKYKLSGQMPTLHFK